MEKELSSKESLAIITDMITKAKKEAAGDGGFQILLWGWVVSCCNFGQYALEKGGYSTPYVVWLLIVPTVLVSIVWGKGKSRRTKIKTHLDEVMNLLWIGIFVGIMIVLTAMPKLGFNHSPVILILAAIGMFTTGSLIQVRAVKFGAATLALGAIIGFQLQPSEQCLVSGLAILLGYLVPGYYLKNMYRERI